MTTIKTDLRTIEEIRESNDRTVGDYLVIDDGTFRCAKCNYELGPVNENFKGNLVMREREVETLGEIWIDPSLFLDEDIVFREFYCPECATRIATESCRRTDPVVTEIKLDKSTLE